MQGSLYTLSLSTLTILTLCHACYWLFDTVSVAFILDMKKKLFLHRHGDRCGDEAAF